MLLYGVLSSKEYGVVTPADPLITDLFLQLVQGLYALIDTRYAGLYVLPVGGYGVLEMGIEAIRYLMQVLQDGAVVLRTEFDTIYLIWHKLISRDLVGEQRIA